MLAEKMKKPKLSKVYGDVYLLTIRLFFLQKTVILGVTIVTPQPTKCFRGTQRIFTCVEQTSSWFNLPPILSQNGYNKEKFVHHRFRCTKTKMCHSPQIHTFFIFLDTRSRFQSERRFWLQSEGHFRLQSEGRSRLQSDGRSRDTHSFCSSGTLFWWKFTCQSSARSLQRWFIDIDNSWRSCHRPYCQCCYAS